MDNIPRLFSFYVNFSTMQHIKNNVYVLSFMSLLLHIYYRTIFFDQLFSNFFCYCVKLSTAAMSLHFMVHVSELHVEL